MRLNTRIEVITEERNSLHGTIVAVLTMYYAVSGKKDDGPRKLAEAVTASHVYLEGAYLKS
jgi:hypothetical protein